MAMLSQGKELAEIRDYINTTHLQPVRSRHRYGTGLGRAIQLTGGSNVQKRKNKNKPEVNLVEGGWPPRAVVSSTTIKPGHEAEVYMDYMMDDPHRFDLTMRTNDPATPELVLITKSDWGP